MSIIKYGSARVTGYSHRARNCQCQDSVSITCITVKRKKYLLMAVADGHGHPIHDLSATGAKIATDSAIELLTKKITRSGYKFLHKIGKEFATELCLHFNQRILEDSIAKKHDFSPIRYGTTLSFAIYSGDYLKVGRIGDGSTVVRNKSMSYVLWEQEEKIRGNETDSMCLVDAAAHFSFAEINNCQGVLLATDGLVNSLASYEKLTTILNYFIERLEEDKSNEGIDPYIHNLAEKCAVHGYGDDVTIAVAASLM